MGTPQLITSGRAGGAERDSDTHGMVAVGTGGTTVGETVVGSIVLPADGDWQIFGLWAQVVQQTEVAAEAVIGYASINASAGDLKPNPSPTKFPFPAFNSSLGTALPKSVSPLHVFPLQYTAPGKAALDLIIGLDVAMTVAPDVVMGIIFGKNIPEPRRMHFADSVGAAVSATASTALGTVTIAERASTITAIGGILVQDGVTTTVEQLSGFFSLSSDDAKLPPAEFPFASSNSGGLGATIGGGEAVMPMMIPVNIPVPGGARIGAACKLRTAVTNPAFAKVTLYYE